MEQVTPSILKVQYNFVFVVHKSKDIIIILTNAFQMYISVNCQLIYRSGSQDGISLQNFEVHSSVAFALTNFLNLF